MLFGMMEYAAALRRRRLGAGAKPCAAAPHSTTSSAPSPHPSPRKRGEGVRRGNGGWVGLLAADGSPVAVAVSGIMGDFEIGQPMRRLEDIAGLCRTSSRRDTQQQLGASRELPHRARPVLYMISSLYLAVFDGVNVDRHDLEVFPRSGNSEESS
jgi:hypothetical protein